jgi:hypothetical protein
VAFVIVVVVEFNSVFVIDGAVVDFIVVEKSMGKFFKSDIKEKNSIDQKKIIPKSHLVSQNQGSGQKNEWG